MKKVSFLLLFLCMLSISYAQSVEDLEIRHKDEVARKKQIQSSRNSKGRFTLFDDYENTWGAAYDYSKDFPLALSVNYAIPYFCIGTEFGLNLNNKSYKTKDTDNALEYSDPSFYITIKPGLNLEYITMSCGLGCIYSTKDISETSPGHSYSIKNDPNWGFFIKPELTGLIPICDKDYYISLHVGYNIAPKFKELNGISFGAGLQVSLY